MTREIYGIVNEDEYKSIELITNKVHCSKQATENYSFPEEAQQDIKTAFYKAAIDNLSEAQFLEKMWWKEILKKYNLVGRNDIYIDFDTRELYSIK